MKRIGSSLFSRAHVSHHGRSGRGLTYDGPLSIFDQEGWPTATWSWAVPAVLCDIDGYVHALPGRQT
jgi:hypothetical protein